MLKRLLFTLIGLLFLIPSFGQTHPDSIKNNPVVDSAAKSLAGDTAAKKGAVDSVKKNKLSDTSRHISADTVGKQFSSDSSTVNHMAAEHHTKQQAPKPVSHIVPADSEPLHSPLKTLSDLRYNAYIKGEDLDEMSLAAELNHFPLPDRVLKFKKQLDLSPIQVGQISKLASDLHRKKVEMGSGIIRNEKMLDSLFHIRRVDEGSLIFYTNRSGLYYGELKGAILMACYNTEKLLTPAQIKKLEALEKAN